MTRAFQAVCYDVRIPLICFATGCVDEEFHFGAHRL